jgi:imidazolonepropionase
MIEAELLIRRIGRLATLAGTAPRTGSAMRDLGIREDAAVAASGGRIAWVGRDDEARSSVALRAGGEEIDAAGAAVVPGFVDAHTHLAFAGDRDDEIRQRLTGASYQQIAAAGGGIVKTVGATRAASSKPASTRCCSAAPRPRR